MTILLSFLRCPENREFAGAKHIELSDSFRASPLFSMIEFALNLNEIVSTGIRWLSAV